MLLKDFTYIGSISWSSVIIFKINIKHEKEEWSIALIVLKAVCLSNIYAIAMHAFRFFSGCNIIHADHSNSLCRSMPKWIRMVAAAYSISYRFYYFGILQRTAISAVSKSLCIVVRGLGTTMCVKIEYAVRIFMTTCSVTVLIHIQWHYLCIILSTLNLFLQSQ